MQRRYRFFSSIFDDHLEIAESARPDTIEIVVKSGPNICQISLSRDDWQDLTRIGGPYSSSTPFTWTQPPEQTSLPLEDTL